MINEINRKTSDGSQAAPVPDILGMKFQEVSVGQKLPVGGYADATGTPSPLLAGAIAHVDASLSRFVKALKAHHLLDSTLIIVSAKHGQSPIDPSKLAMEDGSSPAVKGHFQTDDVGLLWLQDQSPTHVSDVVAELTDPVHRAAIFANVLPPGTIFSSNITSATSWPVLRRPHLRRPGRRCPRAKRGGAADWGVIYSGSGKKISEHGGWTLDDTHVALLLSNPGLKQATVREHVSTMQVAPAILQALGLDPDDLQAVRMEETHTLPRVF